MAGYRPWGLAVALPLIFLPGLAWAADAPLVQGRYANRNGAFSIEFGPGGKAALGGVGSGATLAYAVSGRTVTVQTPSGPRELTILDEDRLQTPEGMALLRDRAYGCRDADGEIGTLILDHAGRVLLRAPAGTPEAKEPPQALGTYVEDAASVTIRQPDGSNTYRRDGRDLKAETVTCRRS